MCRDRLALVFVLVIGIAVPGLIIDQSPVILQLEFRTLRNDLASSQVDSRDQETMDLCASEFPDLVFKEE